MKHKMQNGKYMREIENKKRTDLYIAAALAYSGEQRMVDQNSGKRP